MEDNARINDIDHIIDTVIHDRDGYKPYRIWKYNGLDQSIVSRLRDGSKHIDNVPWKHIRKIVAYYDAKKKGLTD